MDCNFKFGIIGSGFSGSLLAWILAKQGGSVVLLDRTAHPRFAVGESSTPLADFLLEQIAERYSLPELKPLSRWGSWQQSMPFLRAGKKRGFSYFSHRVGQAFGESSLHENSLLVAASVSDELSDTHWMRCDVDQWICQQAVAAGAELHDCFDAKTIKKVNGRWRICGVSDETMVNFEVEVVIDASSGGVFQQLMHDKPLTFNKSESLQTRTASVFGHFRGVRSMTEWLRSHDLQVEDDPFDSDDAAQHHWIGPGWIWMLRFSEGTCSVGITLPSEWMPSEFADPHFRHEYWKPYLAKFPTVAELMQAAELVGPTSHDGMPQLAFIPRISRLSSPAAGENWFMLPSSVGLIDPLHSTGIAHALSGVLRVADILTTKCSSSEYHALMQAYSADVVHEVRWIDQLVNSCYQAASASFDAFTAASCLYFVAAIHCERQMAVEGQMRDGFLMARSTALQSLVRETQLRLETESSSPSFALWMREQLKPWNDVGLLEPASRNRIFRSVAPK